MNHYVYEITNLVNGKKYIGKRSCKCPIEEDKYMGSGKKLKEAFIKYGIQNFEKRILFICKDELDALYKEIEVIYKTDACKSNDYYNISIGGGIISSNKNKNNRWVVSPEYRKKQSRIALERYKEQPMSDETKRKIADSHKRKVILLNNLTVYDSIIDASLDTKIGKTDISRVCKGSRNRKSAGKINGEPAKWMYYEDYLKTIK